MSHSTIIILIAGILVTVGGILVITEVISADHQSLRTTNVQQRGERGSDDLILVNAVGFNITNSTYKYTKLQVKYEGDEPLNLNSTLIQVRTGTSQVHLQYRDGTPERDFEDGFYTQ